MCGIAGIYRADGGLPSAEVLAEMTRRLARRGPDGSGVHLEPGVGLAHRRLSIIDLSPAGSQPMSNEDGTVWLAFNGEIYNYRELRKRLDGRPHAFRSESDAETLIHLYEDHRDDLPGFLGDVRGMFAFALWDRSRARLVLARDRLGIKPLFVSQRAERLTFASDLDALTADPEVPREVDWSSVYEYLLLLTVPEPHTIFRGVSALPPGTLLSVEGGRLRSFRYWALDGSEAEPIRSEGEAVEALQAALAESVRSHLVADVEVGSFLSGGIDSGLVTSEAAAQLGHGVRTFSMCFPGEAIDEGPLAREAASHLGTRHSEMAVREGFLDGIDEVVEAMDQPMALPSAVSLFRLSRMARGAVKVVLTGDGGDELFGGYGRHRDFDEPAPRLRGIPRSVQRRLARFGLGLLPEGRTRWPRVERGRALCRALALDEAQEYGLRLFQMSPHSAFSLFTPEIQAQIEPDRYVGRVRSLFRRCRSRSALSRMLFVDVHTSLVDEMLAKADRMTMAWGLEARVPLLDHPLVELSRRVDPGLLRRGGLGKVPLRRLAGARLGEAASLRPKRGFESPLKADDEVIRACTEALSTTLETAEGIERGALAARAKEEAGNGTAGARNLFALIVLGLWARQRRVGL